MTQTILTLALLAVPALPVPASAALAPLQDERRGGQGDSNDAQTDKETAEKEKAEKERAERDAGREGRNEKEEMMRRNEEARRKGMDPTIAAGIPVATMTVAPRWVLAGTPLTITVTRIDPPAQPGAPPAAAAGRITPESLSIASVITNERRKLDATTAKAVTPPADPQFVAGPNAVRQSFDLTKALEGMPTGPIGIHYEFAAPAAPGGRSTATGTAFVLQPLKTVDAETLDPKSVYLAIETDQGVLVVDFLADKAPNTVRHFLRLVAKGFYDGLAFHRIVKGHLVQGGDPATAGKAYDGQPIAAEFNDVPHRRGILAMARGAEPDSATTSFFIVHGSHERNFDKGYAGDQAFPTTPFARVVEGLETLDRLAAVPVGPNARGEVSLPTTAPVVKRMVLCEKSSAARPATPPGASKPAAAPAATRPAPARG